MDRVQYFKEIIESRDFPCVGAKSALVKENMTFVLAGDISDSCSDREIYKTLNGLERL